MKNAAYFVVDENLAAMAGAMSFILSQYDHYDIHVFVERSNRSIAPSELIPDTVTASNRIHYHFDRLSEFLPDKLPETEQWPKIVYLRLFAPHILSNYSRLIYLDADIAIFRDLQPLFEIEFPFTVGAVHDHGMLKKTEVLRTEVEPSTNEWPHGIGLEGCRYFNSGVLLINTEKWTLLNFQKLIPAYFEKYGQRIRAFDQDFLNYTFKKSWMELSPSWNFQTSLFDLGFEHTFQPAIVHFTGPSKPWNDGLNCLPSAYQKYFTELYDFLGLPHTQTNSKRKLLKKAKAQIRRLLHSIGIQSKRSRKHWYFWEKRFRTNKKFVMQALRNERYADDRTQKQIEEPNVFFDGYTIRTRNLKRALSQK
ncbi:glycosyltransferase family 8 protein [Pseudovibrio ascidiaceicola]|uniref:glycosyltransferase family 8 protein n=1 Tax=Pseudovibrio ascidiaceicola TaxID=285279 RepID=UPI003D3684E1